MTHPNEDEYRSLPLEEALAFAAIHKRHFGTAIGAAVALLVGGLTLIDAAFNTGGGDQPLRLLSAYFYGYEVSYVGALVGAGWGFFVGFVGGWFVAFSRNFVLAATIFWVRAKANLRASTEFLDHI